MFEAFGIKRIATISGLWGVVNNAGIMQSYAPTEWTTIEEFERTCRVNLFGTISVTLTFLPLLRRSKGRLVNVCSVTSNCGYPGLTSYVTSKAAVKTFTSCLRYASYVVRFCLFIWMKYYFFYFNCNAFIFGRRSHNCLLYFQVCFKCWFILRYLWISPEKLTNLENGNILKTA